ncbi:3-oxoacyl-[acyl-carrier-protein] reductase [Treponema saccharophilum]|jgi:3-oxoacyl-[acyl-carrier protein] reductase|uniref:3-oxoacyl-[acyl-carrier-protein] reductase n=1 Tax=Treponema saccharophilum DSM 2985 TaxID=907348 RepID=H7EN58_9SPIR|nr:3-oxoacyl-[acyl-carrier-protein] reductase [Treponema saccharophilum]EIC01122.1 3-oxoacyl-(acyl-carrier-protein) reductase [Treponema saccharophilum DSM 2985]BDC95435.1 3-oxoacyl-ACP reductase [Treponema saccharophilum]
MALLEKKKALVTGSSRGIGRGIVEKFLAEGCEVWGLCSKPSAAKAELEKIASDNGVAFHEIYADVGDEESVTSVVKGALSESGGFDILVNNAGITRDGLSFRMKKSDWDDVIRVNLTSAFLICQIVSNDMLRKRSGSIINMSSIVGVHGQGGQVNYAASKGGLIAYSKSLAKEVGGRGIRVNCIAPGFIATDMTAVLKEDLQKSMIDSVPLKRAGTPADIAGAALFLASDMSAYVTAQVIGVDGGMGA